MAETPRVTVWNEYRHELSDEKVAKIYPEGIHGALAAMLEEGGFEVRTATLDEPEHGLTEEALGATDVLLWWGHVAHDEVSDEVVERVHGRVLGGMGLIVLHSGHFSKIFTRLMGTTCEVFPSSRVMVRAMASRRCRSRSAARVNTPARSSGAVARHVGNALRAASRARSRSAVLALGTCPRVRPVAGSTTSTPPRPSRPSHSPSTSRASSG